MVDRLLQSILESSYKNIEIIVIDDFSNDLTYQYLEKKYKENKRILVQRNKKNLFTAGSRNVGFRHAKGEFVFFIDDDNLVDAKTIEFLAKALLDDATIGEVGPVNYSFDNKTRILWAGTKRNMYSSFTSQSRNLSEFGTRKIWETDDVPNAFMVRASAIKKNKISFNSFFGIMYEESDYAYKIKKAGYSIRVVRNAKIFHDTENTSKGAKSKNYMYHFMTDPRRPYVFARNRLVFHKTYSSRVQLLSILLIWMWFFTIYYSLKIFSYSGKFSILRRLQLVWQYLKGDFAGIGFIVRKRNLY